MAGVLFTNILEALGLESGNTEEEQRVDELYEELEDQDYDRQWSHRKRHKVVKTNDGKELSMLLVKPKTHADAQIIIDSLKIRRPVIVNLENNDYSEAQRVIDFVSGAVYALGGEVKEISKKIFAIVPANIGFTTGE